MNVIWILRSFKINNKCCILTTSVVCSGWGCFNLAHIWITYLLSEKITTWWCLKGCVDKANSKEYAPSSSAIFESLVAKARLKEYGLLFWNWKIPPQPARPLLLSWTLPSQKPHNQFLYELMTVLTYVRRKVFWYVVQLDVVPKPSL